MLKLIIMQQIINTRYCVKVNTKFQPMNALLLVSTGYSTPKAVLLAPRISKGPVKSEGIQSRIQLTSEVWNGQEEADTGLSSRCH